MQLKTSRVADDFQKKSADDWDCVTPCSIADPEDDLRDDDEREEGKVRRVSSKARYVCEVGFAHRTCSNSAVIRGILGLRSHLLRDERGDWVTEC